MPTETARPARWKRVLGYTAFALFSFLLGLYLTFPYDALARVVKNTAESAGYEVQFGSMGPGLFGVTARQVRLMRKAPPGEEANPMEGLLLDSVALRPSLFPPGVALSADAMGGSVRGSVGRLGSSSLRLTLEGLDTKKGNFQNFTGIDMNARLDGRLSLDVPTVEKGSEPDFGAASGLLSLELGGVQVNGGT
jgi:type II secretion system protein N